MRRKGRNRVDARTVERPPASAMDRAAMFGALVDASHFATLEQVPDLVAEQAARVGFTEILIYLADLQQIFLTPLGSRPRQAGDSRKPEDISVDGTVAGRAFQHGEILPVSPGDSDHWWVPLLNGADRLGVLRVTVPGADAAARLDMHRLAGLVALMVISKRALSDTYSRLVRRKPMNVAAEMEWRLMPPRTFATGALMLSALMEPAYEISGDTYDYAIDGSIAHLAVFDAMGHDTTAGLSANLALSTARKTRAEGADLASITAAVDQILMEQFPDRFVTGILADLDIGTGTLQWLSRGHPPPVLIRGRTSIVLDCPPGPPMGAGVLDVPDRLCRQRLQPGDNLLLYTDGITEAHNPPGEEFGLQRFVDFLIRHQADELPVPETLRRLIHHHLDYHQGRLNDDATVLLVEWRGRAGFATGEAEDRIGLPDKVRKG